MFSLLAHIYSSPATWAKDLSSEVCFRSIAWFSDPHYLSRISPHSIRCAWNSRIWNFEFRKTRLPLRNLWKFAPCKRFRPVSKPPGSDHTRADAQTTCITKDSGTNHVRVNLWLTLYKLTGWLASPRQRPHLSYPQPTSLLWHYLEKFEHLKILFTKFGESKLFPEINLIQRPA